MEKRKIVLMTIVIFVVGLIITGASYAFWSWNSTINKNVVFNTSNNLKNYIVYNEGESAFTGELNVSNNYQTGGIHSTISIYKTTNVNLLATIHMDINQIGENMKNSPALKWVVTEGTTSNVGAVLAKGNFIGTKSGDVLTLVPDINVTTTETFYTIWIWLDSSANPSDNLSGETLDTNVWTEINQVEGSEDRYEVTNTTANYQAISATVVDSKYKVTHYAVTTTNSEPTSWTTITPETDQAKVYNLNTTVNNTGTYYIWFKDESGRIKSKEVEVTTVDTSKPSCNWGAFTPVKIANGITSTVTLTCTDNESGISVHNLQTTDLTPSNNRITISNITKESVTNGYKYTITVTGTTNDGTSHLSLTENKVKNGVNLGNNSTSSGDIIVENIISVSDSIVTLEYTSTTYNGSAKTPSVTVTKNGTTLTKDTDYTVTYTNNTNVGTATVTITGINNYGGETSKSFTISYNAFNITLDNANATTNGTSTIYMRYADGVYLNNTYTTKMTTSANPITIPQRTNYTFLGYYDGTTQMIDATGKITSAFTNTKYSAAKTLNAHWTDSVDPEVSISATTNNNIITATAIASDIGSGLDGKYYFKASTSNSCDENTTGFETKTTNTYTYTMPESNLYYVCIKVVDNDGNAAYAVSDAVSDILVTFDSNGGSVTNPATKYVVKNQPYGDLPTSEREGYTFDGWTNEAYQEVEYIESSGTQYIDTDFVASGGMIAEYEAAYISDGGYIVGSHNTGSPYGRNGGFYNSSINKWELGYGDFCPQVEPVITYNRKYKVKFSTVIGNAYLDLDGTRIISNTNSTTISNNHVLVFTNQYTMANNETYAKAKLYSLKIYNSTNELVRDFIPSYRISDNTVGLYDKVNNVFYANAGTGAFTKGEDVAGSTLGKNITSSTTVTTTESHTLTAKWVDDIAPIGTLSLTDDNWVINATVNASDTGSGIKQNYGWTMIDTDDCNSSVTGFVETSENTYTFMDSLKYYVCARIEDNAGNYTYLSQRIPASYYLYTGDVQSFTASENGYYKVETWGAGGWNTVSSYVTDHPTYGGYSGGYIQLNSGDKLYVYVGGVNKPFNHTLDGSQYSYNAGTGSGGATDIRYFGSTTPSTSDLVWSSTLGLNSRIMVAGGAGGTYGDSTGSIGSNGGGLITNDANPAAANTGGGGATQISGGAAGHNGTAGGFGYGGTNTTQWYSFGGSGYYGGGSGSGSAGGTSFISGYAGVNAITSSSDRTHTNNTLHYSNKYFIDNTMTAGTNSGNGKARIQYVGDTPARVNTDLNNVRYIIDCATGSTANTYKNWIEVQAIKNGVNIAKGKSAVLASGDTLNNAVKATDGIIDDLSGSGNAYINDATGMQCIVIDLEQIYDIDEIAVWHYYGDGRTFNNNVTYVSADDNLWIPVINKTEAETANGKRVTAWDPPLEDNSPRAEYDYTGDYQTFTVPVSGYYKVETWGAKGGGAGAANGGYSSGYINLSTNDTLYIYAGQAGSTATNIKTFNSGTGNSGGYNGGGATDVRYFGTTTPSSSDLAWDSVLGINSRIMVAGGGGSASSGTGGTGGTLIGKSGGGTNGGTQTTYGAVQSTSYTASSFGIANGGCSGGNGYYPGGGATCANGAGGGSSFISGYAGVNAITSSSNRTHTNNTLHYSNKYFIDNTMTAGTNSGNGKAKITFVGDAPEKINNDLNNVRYIKDCMNGSSHGASNHWVELQAIKNGVNLAKGITITGINNKEGYPLTRITDGDITSANYAEGTNSQGYQCITVDLGSTYNLDEIAVWHYFTDGRTYSDNVTYVSDNGNLWIPVINKTEAETANGKRVTAWDPPLEDNTQSADFYYTGDYQTFTVPISGYYKVETWGAQGGEYTSSQPAGKGGYSSGYLYLNQDDTLYVYVGEMGIATTNSSNRGGYNGGGTSGVYSTPHNAGGGGATDIRLVSGEWNNSESLNSRIMVAAGGGGVGDYTTYKLYGGNGGTLIGEIGNSTDSDYGTAAYQATGGSQSHGGNSPHIGNESIGQFGYATQTSLISAYGGGGGSGYYGGAEGFGTAGSGGSSFISGYAGVNAITSSSDRTHTNNTLHYSNKFFIDNMMTAGTNTGNGKAKITYVGDAPARINTNLNNVRYIKDCINGNTENVDNHWVELQAIKNGVNLAKGITITGINNKEGYPLTRITDGDITSANYAEGTNRQGYQCITIDLGSTYNLDEIAVWHYFADGRTYNDNVTYVSSDNSNWVAVINKTEVETANGKRVNVWHLSDGAQITITYDANGGTGAPEPTTYAYDSSGNTTTNLSTVIPTREDYTFMGWSTSSTATTASYSAGALWSRSNLDNTLYAVWAHGHICSSGQYLPQGEATCVTCPAGSACAGGVFEVDTSSDQGIMQCSAGTFAAAGSSSCTTCVAGSYSSAGAGACTACAKGTTSQAGSTSCNTNCSNTSNVSAWNTPVWNSNNTMTNSCSISSCASGYTVSSNQCKRNYTITTTTCNATYTSTTASSSTASLNYGYSSSDCAAGCAAYNGTCSYSGGIYYCRYTKYSCSIGTLASNHRCYYYKYSTSTSTTTGTSCTPQTQFSSCNSSSLDGKKNITCS